jgi:hypothetical protein
LEYVLSVGGKFSCCCNPNNGDSTTPSKDLVTSDAMTQTEREEETSMDFEVEEVLAVRIKKEYLLQWVGYSE